MRIVDMPLISAWVAIAIQRDHHIFPLLMAKLNRKKQNDTLPNAGPKTQDASDKVMYLKV
jgi:hypothetical protein